MTPDLHAALGVLPVAGLVEGEVMAAQLAAARGLLAEIAAALPRVPSGNLAGIAAQAAAVVTAAKAVQAAVVLEADQRGVIASSDNPRPSAWVEASHREVGAPINPATAKVCGSLVAAVRGGGMARLRKAIIDGEVSIETAEQIAAAYRRLRAKVEIGNWDVLLEELIGWAAQGMRRRDLAALEDALLDQYGTATEFEERERLHDNRNLTTFRRDPRTGMYEARVKLDPASEAVFTAAINALSAPRTDPETGALDMRTPGARRADALLGMASRAAQADPNTPGTGAKARIVITMRLEDLRAQLDQHLAESSDTHLDDNDTPTTPDGTRSTPRATGTPNRPTGPRGGVTDFGQALPASAVRMFACDAGIIPAVLGTKSEVLDLGREERLATPGLTRHLAHRDKSCTYPGCTMPPAWTDAHHITHWADGGHTRPGNMTLLCRHHHTVVHRHEHIATIDDTGVHWTRNNGTPIGNQPRR